MEYNKYSIFLEVARLNNLSRVAETLGYTQSGVSHTIRRMEEEMDLTLFNRTRSGVYLTSAGRELLPYVQQMEQCRENLDQAISSLHNIHQGTLNIGTYSSISRNWLPNIIRSFKEDYPSIMIHFKEGGNEDITNWMNRRDVDLGFLSRSQNQQKDEMDWIALSQDPLMAILPADYSWDEETFPLEAFNDQTFIISALGTDIDIHNVLDRYQIHPDIQYSAQDDYTILSMVSCHLGISILPQLVLDKNTEALKILPLSTHSTRELGIAVPSLETASPATRKFIEYAKEYVGTHMPLTGNR